MMRRVARGAWALAAAVALVLASTSCLLFDYATGRRDGCSEYKRTLEFETSNEIVRGVWKGIAHDYPVPGTDTDLTLDLTATYVDEGSYTVAGTYALGADTPLTLAGTVDGGCSERFVVAASAAEVVPQALDRNVAPTSAPPPARFMAEVRDAEGVLQWTVEAVWGVYQYTPSPDLGELLLWITSAFDLGEDGPYGEDIGMVRATSP